jgi:hypothetical protein
MPSDAKKALAQTAIIGSLIKKPLGKDNHLISRKNLKRAKRFEFSGPTFVGPVFARRAERYLNQAYNEQQTNVKLRPDRARIMVYPAGGIGGSGSPLPRVTHYIWPEGTPCRLRGHWSTCRRSQKLIPYSCSTLKTGQMPLHSFRKLAEFLVVEDE